MIRTRLLSFAVVAAVVLGACQATTLPAQTGSGAADASASAAPVESGAGTASDAPAASAAPTRAPAASQAPAATSGPTSAPSASATAATATVDAAAAFKDAMGDPLLTANVTFTGLTTLGSTVTPTTGTLDIHKPSSHLTITAGAGRMAVTNEAMNSTGARYVKRYGQWFDAGTAAPENLLLAATTIDGQVTDTGIETVGGQQLHHLTITPPSTIAAALLLSGKGISNVAGTVDAWAEEDGTPVLMRLGAEFDQLVGKKTVHGTKSMDLTFANVGEQVAITPPAQIWTWATSKKYGYKMGYPSDWQYEKSVKKFIDTYWGYDGDLLGVERSKSYGLTLNRIATYVTKNAAALNRKAVKIASNKPGKLGPLPARIVQYSGKVGKTRYYFVLYLAVKGSKLYWVELRTDKKTTSDDRKLAAAFAGTFLPK